MRHGEEEQWDALTAEYVRVVREATGAPEDVAFRAAAQMVRVFRQRFAGAQLYVSHPPRYDEAAVLRDLTPDNVDQVCSRHRIHRSTVYRIVKRARRRGETVPDLPPQETSPASPTAAPVRPRKPEDFSW